MSGFVKTTLILSVFNAPLAMAAGTCPGTPHTVHAITTNKSATCVLSKLYEPTTFCIADTNGNDIEGTPFQVEPGQTAGFGMIVGDGADFNMEYALTCASNDGASANSPKSIFTIGAKGPARPDVSTINLNGAQSAWQDTGNGENYSLTF